ncbi:FGGY family carbohydrate kinase [Sphingomicrobium astaxanthinifaciens]|uniref:FGGY family carbohydrate kinase n=1 Tax=Sphingomicrobium astaxanthinifaciens TaxID=1227949 RepID=UPI001FCAC276|nr:glycerol kinase GlpK [Sphingomicrobium astaxanthinifaciens]MCJ7420935.1 glycerol kinase GlpK [Sphingomicrobium astaxanthinifaciens]
MILVLDEGTSSTRALLFADDGAIAHVAQADLPATYPQPGWVEQDPKLIWDRSRQVMAAAVAAAGGPGKVGAIGIANQRETVVAWDRTSGAPLAPAIVWQDRRTAAACDALREAGHEPALQAQTGLLLDPYFSATKMRWLLDHHAAVREAAAAGRLALGTVDAWLLFKLTGRHASDASNASRTLLMDLEKVAWDAGLCDLFGVPREALPEIVPTAGELGTTDLFGGAIAVTGSAGDQQAATIGQACLAPGRAKATFGTGLFALAPTGATPARSRHRLLSTLLSHDGTSAAYALEGAVFVAGSLVKWLRDMAGLVEHAEETEALARSVEDSGGVTIIPAFTGLGAPHWRADLTGSIHGLTFGVGRAHLVRAALEAVTMSAHDLGRAFAADGAAWTSLRIDGGMARNDWFAQDLADILAIGVERPANIESTARGAAMLAAVGAGRFASLEEACAMQPRRDRFTPAMAPDARAARLDRWHAALDHALAR